MWMVVLVIVGLAIVFLLFAPALTTKIPTELPVSLPTEMKISMPEIKFPEIPAFPEIPEFPELPDFEGMLEGVLDKIPSKEDIIDMVTPIVDVVPTVDEVVEGAKDLTPEWFTDPFKLIEDAYDKAKQEAGEVFETTTKAVTEPFFAPTKALEPALTSLGEAIDQNVTTPFLGLFGFKKTEEITEELATVPVSDLIHKGIRHGGRI